VKLFVIIGLGQFGRHTARTLYSGGGDVIAIDKDEGRVERIKDEVGQAICADATDIDVLRTIGVAKADTAVVALGENDLEASIMACMALSDLGVGRLIVRSATQLHGRILTRVGATRVIYPEKQMGEQLALSILASGVLEQTTLSTGQTVAHIRPRRDFVGKSIRESQIGERFRLAIIALQRPKNTIDDRGEQQEELTLMSVPSPETIIDSDDILVVVGSSAQIEQVARRD
jgi:trk system potassium uptake protein TrkA